LKLLIFIVTLLLFNPALAYMDTIKSAVNKASNKYNVNPNLIMAIMKVESTFNPLAVGKDGEVGLMQLRPKFHKGVTFGIENNIMMGTRYLMYIKKLKQMNHNEAWFVYYNRGPFSSLDNPKKTLYYKKVMKALKEKYYDSKT